MDATARRNRHLRSLVFIELILSFTIREARSQRGSKDKNKQVAMAFYRYKGSSGSREMYTTEINRIYDSPNMQGQTPPSVDTYFAVLSELKVLAKAVYEAKDKESQQALVTLESLNVVKTTVDSMFSGIDKGQVPGLLRAECDKISGLLYTLGSTQAREADADTDDYSNEQWDAKILADTEALKKAAAENSVLEKAIMDGAAAGTGRIDAASSSSSSRFAAAVIPREPIFVPGAGGGCGGGPRPKTPVMAPANDPLAGAVTSIAGAMSMQVVSDMKARDGLIERERREFLNSEKKTAATLIFNLITAEVNAKDECKTALAYYLERQGVNTADDMQDLASDDSTCANIASMLKPVKSTGFLRNIAVLKQV